MPRTQQCDGRKDCMNGEDEITDCGDFNPSVNILMFNIILQEIIHN